MIEFYGEISMPCKRAVNKRKKRYYAVWLCVLSVIVAGLAVYAGIDGGGKGRDFIVFTVFAVLLALFTAYLFAAPVPRSLEGEKWLFRVQIEGEKILWVQYLPDKTIRKEKMIDSIKKVYRTKFCYYLVYNNLSNAIICERCLLKRGTFDRLEYTFEGKIRNLDI